MLSIDAASVWKQQPARESALGSTGHRPLALQAGQPSSTLHGYASARARARLTIPPCPDSRPAGCNRSFAELWRLKVHFRAPPDVRGSGKERGHGTELQFCPKCGKDLRPGKHHVGCSAGKSAPRQAAKRQRQVRTWEAGASGDNDVVAGCSLAACLLRRGRGSPSPLNRLN